MEELQPLNELDSGRKSLSCNYVGENKERIVRDHKDRAFSEPGIAEKIRVEEKAVETPELVPPPAAGGFPIVGIGASAGALPAFNAFFSGIPADTEPGMAFVLVQHLAPDHKSILVDAAR